MNQTYTGSQGAEILYCHNFVFNHRLGSRKFFAGFFESMAGERWISVSCIEEAKEKVDAYETATTSRFCCVRAPRDFGRTGKNLGFDYCVVFVHVCMIHK